MNKVQEYKAYFDHYNQEWLEGAYLQRNYDYPVGYHRLRILLKSLQDDDLEGKKILDIGCGGGDVSFALAQRGADVIGIDMSDSMLAVARQRQSQKLLKGKVEFFKENVLELSENVSGKKFDYIVAFGLIGYLESDEQFFEVIRRLSQKNTILYLSCRNRLFNITSTSPNTVREMQEGTAFKLIDEIDAYYEKEIPPQKSMEFLENLNSALEKVKHLNSTEEGEAGREEPRGLGGNFSPARQSTPREVQHTAQRFGYDLRQLWGVHPHLLLPRFNRKLPPQVFNMLSDALCAFEEEEISLVWSSVFIGKYEFV